MRFSSFRYLVQVGFRNLWQNRFMAIASIGVLVSCLILTGGAYMVFENIDRAFEWMYGQNVIVAFAEEGATDEQTAQMTEKLESITNVASVEFVSKEELTSGAGHCGPYGDQCRGGRIAPRQKRPSGVADHAAAGIFDHPPDECQTLGGIQLSVFHVCRISGLKLRICSGCSSLFTGCLRVFCGVSAVCGAAVYSAAG